ncbi:IclR family transcriptional regulator domain-containing protein [Hyphococcus sp.]|uniref:IclR family transcriptional regulator domain-containing protein n=1 Tax=Hyphococcus sp. TaxID=2038636 RepID=UPI003CCC2891
MAGSAVISEKKKTETSNETKAESRYSVGSLAHGLNVIKAFDAEHREMTLTQVAERTGMSRAGARRYLLTLADLGYVYHDERLFRLSPKVMELGYTYLSSEPMTAIVQPYLDQLRDATGETIGLAVLDDGYIVHIARANSKRSLMAPTLTIGRRFPAIYTSPGRVMIALKGETDVEGYLDVADPSVNGPLRKKDVDSIRKALKKAQRDQYAMVEQEIEIGVRTLAVPIFNQSHEVVSALNILTNIAKIEKEYLMNECLPRMQAVAAEIQHAIVD